MAISKDISVHGELGTKNVMSYITDDKKTAIANGGFDVSSLLKDNPDVSNASGLLLSPLLDYAQNTDKTAFILDDDEEILVSGNNCSPVTASFEFLLSKNKYLQKLAGAVRGYGTKKSKYKDKKTGEMMEVVKDKESIEAFHLIQSFPDVPGLDPRLVHHLGLELAQRAFSDHKSIISTHMNTNHLHNHIVICAYKNDGSGKFHMNKKNRNIYRAINDDISHEYALPTLLSSDISNKHLTWLEWDAKRNGDSWKDIIRNDIDFAKNKAQNFVEFISIMQNAGYLLRQTDKYITYTLPGSNTKKCRDKSLGNGYLVSDIKKYFGVDNALDESIDRPLVNNNPNPDNALDYNNAYLLIREKSHSFKVSRYSSSGRRRSDLEIVFLIAIKIIKYFMDKFFDYDAFIICPQNPVYHRAKTKLKTMEQALFMADNLGIDSLSTLKERMNETGANLSHLKRELKDISENYEFLLDTSEKIKALLALKDEINNRSLNNINLYPDSYTSYEIAKNKASKMPMTPKQKKELFILLDDKGYKLSRKFDSITYSEAINLIAYLRGQIPDKPSVLLTPFEYDQNKSNRINADNNIDNSSNISKFLGEIKGLDVSDRSVLISARDLINDLRSYGFSENNLDEILNNADELKLTVNFLKTNISSLQTAYRDLSYLNYAYNLANNKSFTHGPLFDMSEDIVIDTVDNADISLKTEDELIEKRIADNNKNLDKTKDFFDSITDSFFDRA